MFAEKGRELVVWTATSKLTQYFLQVQHLRYTEKSDGNATIWILIIK